ncbi:Putative bacteriophage protein [Moritella viscosa]|nr:Putative bacteriophage protein [Moritella viscosa]
MQYHVQKVPLMPLKTLVEHPLTLQPVYGFLSKESSISTATE